MHSINSIKCIFLLDLIVAERKSCKMGNVFSSTMVVVYQFYIA